MSLICLSGNIPVWVKPILGLFFTWLILLRNLKRVTITEKKIYIKYCFRENREYEVLKIISVRLAKSSKYPPVFLIEFENCVKKNRLSTYDSNANVDFIELLIDKEIEIMVSDSDWSQEYLDYAKREIDLRKKAKM